MDLNAIGIPVCFLLLSVLGLWFIIHGKGYWWLKSIFILLILSFGIGLWSSLSDLSGWPTSKDIPDRVIVHWLLVKEPSKLGNDSGGVYILATEIDSKNEAKKSEISKWLTPFISKQRPIEPRVYRLPYSKELHKKAGEAMRLIKANKSVIGEGLAGFGSGFKEGNKKGQGQGNGDGKGQGQGKTKGNGKQSSLSQECEPMFYELPPFKFLDKNVD